MAKSEKDINLKTLQRVDSNILEIMDTACQVAIYKYDSKLEKWEGTDVEGTLFLYRRSLYPCHGFIIVNRMNTTNFVESITSDMQFQLQEPYLLYKNHTGDIVGSWFYERKDLQRISKKIQTIILKQCTVPKRQRCASESESLPVAKDGGQDIMTLLSEAHKEYMKSVVEPPVSDHLSAEKKSPNKVLRRRLRSTGSFEAGSRTDATSRLSPLFSRNEINSPVSDVEFLDSSFEAEGHFDYKKHQLNQKSFGMGTDCDIHSATIKRTLMSHIQDDPKMMLKIHEAYVSSLRSLFSKD